ncbi:MAG TPA: filamentous hemagglutinin N-terminal domain-containing protein, partial [Acetobacteraceae bacterium]|nr:filamentous hemagglutinin N-terminal domain-containing protein [Acetobacteraceae bacterium]
MAYSASASFRAALLCGTALLALPLGARAQPAPNARPLGGTVVAGSAAISHNATTTTITQSSQRAAIDWNSFDVGAQQGVRFQQPSANAVALNRVTGPNPSQIAGHIDANGQVILINPDGVTFYRGAQVNAAGFVASAAGMSNRDFMAGRNAFTQPAHPGARIVNAGTITVKQTGLAVLVAPQVANSGVITAKLGHVVLAGARTATLDLYGDGLVALDVTNRVTEAPGGATALVTNTGTILAQGGSVQLTARAADGLVQDLVDAGGRISTSARGAPGGSVVLNGIGGNITVTGQLAARGTQGGRIEVLPSGTATLARTARLDASGAAGGGTVAVGTTLARASGGPAAAGAARATATSVQSGARIAADATRAGNGGHVAVLSSGTTVMNGTISARGGAQGGNGGSVEASGNVLGFAGTIDVRAPAGMSGSVLFDPATLYIGTVNSATITNPGSVSYALDSGGTDTVSASSLAGLTGSVTLQATSLLEVTSSVSFSNPVSVTLQSGG